MAVKETGWPDAGAAADGTGSPATGGAADGTGSLATGGGVDPQAKSCKGCLYYSSILKSEARNPRCVGLTRTLKQAPRYIIGESEMEATNEGRSLSDFKYACLGYSVFLKNKDNLIEKEGNEAQLPFCVGLELLVDRRTSTADHVPAHVPKKEGINSQIQEPNISHSLDRNFSSRFARSAGLVASGVARNLIRVGRSIKNSFEDILYDSSRPK